MTRVFKRHIISALFRASQCQSFEYNDQQKLVSDWFDELGLKDFFPEIQNVDGIRLDENFHNSESTRLDKIGLNKSSFSSR